MTYSIVAYDKQKKLFAAGVVTKNFAVGTSVPWVKGKVGAVCTQAETNPLIAFKALELLEKGLSAKEALEQSVALDRQSAIRQAHLVDIHGQTASWNGQETVPFSSSLSGDGVSVAGNMLHGEEVLSEMLSGYQDSLGEEMVYRIYNALKRGEEAGGDKRGAGQSACILVANTQPFPVLNLRLDHNDDGTLFEELKVLVDESQKSYVRGFFDNMAATFDEIK